MIYIHVYISFMLLTNLYIAHAISLASSGSLNHLTTHVSSIIGFRNTARGGVIQLGDLEVGNVLVANTGGQ